MGSGYGVSYGDPAMKSGHRVRPQRSGYEDRSVCRDRSDSMKTGIGVYIHIPFCKSKCYYCDFNSYSGREHLAGPYFDALFSEIRAYADALQGRPVRTIFIGGGTPSLVDPKYISRLLEVCSKYMTVDPEAEISLESNPGTLTYDNLKIYREAGINRLSIGLQAWQDKHLEKLGRIHRKQQFVENLESAYKAGFRNINADLIFGLPEQTFEEWKETLEAVTTLGSGKGLSHLSCYSLIIEEGTIFGDRYEAGTLKSVDDELDRKMYSYTIEHLAGLGYKHYEISNFAKPGFECRHNLVYWRAEEYAGFGAGAHSYLNHVRYSNETGIEEYIRAVDNIKNAALHKDNEFVKNGALHRDSEFIGRQDAMSEFMIMGLRLIEGISVQEFEDRFGEKLQEVYGAQLSKLVNDGLLVVTQDGSHKNDLFQSETSEKTSEETPEEKQTKAQDNKATGSERFRLTARGLDLANRVFVEFI